MITCELQLATQMHRSTVCLQSLFCLSGLHSHAIEWLFLFKIMVKSRKSLPDNHPTHLIRQSGISYSTNDRYVRNLWHVWRFNLSISQSRNNTSWSMSTFNLSRASYFQASTLLACISPLCFFYYNNFTEKKNTKSSLLHCCLLGVFTKIRFVLIRLSQVLSS